MGIEVRPLTPQIGAEVFGVDVTKPMGNADFDTVHQALLDHSIIVFREQPLDDNQLMGLGRQFGPLIVHPFLQNDGPNPEVIHIKREPQDKAIVGQEWHSDTTCIETPPLAGVLHCIETPLAGGDTLFASQYRAWETLSDGMKEMLDGMIAVHNDTRVAGPQSGVNGNRANRVRDDADWKPSSAEHPVVRTHPETGRKGLFVNISYTRYFKGMTEAESAPLLNFLYRHAVRPEFTCRVQWRPGSTVIWDNRCVKHLAVHDCGPHRREMHRVQVAGDRPY